jgi:hypothetical protein
MRRAKLFHFFSFLSHFIKPFVNAGKASKLQSVSKTIQLLIGIGFLFLLLFVPGVNALAQVCVQPPQNMISWWPGESNADDFIGANHGALMAGATIVPGMVGQAFSFDRTGGYVEVPHNPSLNPTTSLTVSAWIYHKSIAYADPIVTKGGEGLGQYNGFSLEFGGAFLRPFHSLMKG